MVSTILRGGIGNQMFQTVMAFAHSLKHGLELVLPTKIDTPHYPWQQVHRFPGLTYSDDIPDLPLYKEEQFDYKEIPFMDNVCFDGYWQSYKYFEDYREEILKAFNFQYGEKKNYCSIHIRLGDYMDKPACHPPVTFNYIFEAMMTIMTRVQDWQAIKFLVFSDSPRLAKEMFSAIEFRTFSIEYSTGKDEVEDMELASSCQWNIGSNSAYSWWIHYLNKNPNKIGVFPSAWFGSALPNNTSDLYPPNCVII